MTVEQARALRPVFEGYCEGKVVQTKLKQGFAGPPWTEWKDWDGRGEFGHDMVEWRVKPEAREWDRCNQCGYCASTETPCCVHPENLRCDRCCSSKGWTRVREVLE